jgi:large subunit ribosomal protein L6
MSRIGKLPIPIPEGVDVQIAENNKVSIKGPKGLQQIDVHPNVSVALEDGRVVVTPKSASKQARALHGLTRALLANMVEGVTNGYIKKLEIVGIGYKANVAGKVLTLNLGFSHPIQYPIPGDIDILVEKQTNISVKGIDKQRVGQVAAEIRYLKPPEPYKGKGIRYEGEVIRRKVGKAGA